MIITEAQLVALLRYAEPGAASLDETAQFLVLRTAIDDLNGISRYTLSIKWQSVPQGPPPPDVTEYPVMQTATLTLTRPITRNDVDERLRGETTGAGLVLVTPDPQALVGWTVLEDYEF
jgi:hypothetical protein